MSDLKTLTVVEAVFATPYPAVPPHTNRGVQHQVIEASGYYASYANWTAGLPLVYGRTKCGKSGLLMDRTAGGFPLCKRCYPPDQ